MLIVGWLPEADIDRYGGLKGECSERSVWMYGRIYKNPKPIDVAFIGSSHTINAVEDALIMRESKNHITAVNLGFCRFGRDFHFQLIQDLIDHKKVKTIVLEVSGDENRSGHPDFPYLGSTKNVVASFRSSNPEYIQNIWKHFLYKIELFHDALWKIKDTSKIEDFRDTGFPEWVEQGFLPKMPTLSESEHSSNAKANMPRVPKYYLHQIQKLCDGANVELVYLYLPPLNSNLSAIELEFYKQNTRLLIPPKELLEDHTKRIDRHHFNHAGAIALSRWLIGELGAN